MNATPLWGNLRLHGLRATAPLSGEQLFRWSPPGFGGKCAFIVRVSLVWNMAAEVQSRCLAVARHGFGTTGGGPGKINLALRHQNKKRAALERLWQRRIARSGKVIVYSRLKEAGPKKLPCTMQWQRP